MFEYDVYTEEELEKIGLIPDGEYPFEVIEGTIHTCGEQAKNPGKQIPKMRLKIWADDKIYNISQLLWNAKLIKHFCDSVGLEKEYSAKKFNPLDCAGLGGYCKIITLPDNQKKLKNEVEDFIHAKANAKLPGNVVSKAAEDFFKDDQDIPF